MYPRLLFNVFPLFLDEDVSFCFLWDLFSLLSFSLSCKQRSLKFMASIVVVIVDLVVPGMIATKVFLIRVWWSNVSPLLGFLDLHH
jgi:hypothetical protein